MIIGLPRLRFDSKVTNRKLTVILRMSTEAVADPIL